MTGALPVLSVTQLNTYIRSLFESDTHLMQVFVAGEISNFTNHYRSGHFYLSLKDDACVVKAVMFSQYARRLRFLPEDGMRVIARGHVSVYEASGQYQLYIEDMQPDGLGALNLAFEQLKARLEKEGLFRPERKKPLPRFPECVGVITSPTGAAVHDILTILARRYSAAEVAFHPVQVQGSEAAAQLVAAIRKMNSLRCCDVIIIGRGGGSMEDLWAFNEESVVRAVAASELPVISAVGHETDFTLCDFAADLRAPTPSAAAEMAVPDSGELLAGIRSFRLRMNRAMEAKINSSRERLDILTAKRAMQDPGELIALHRDRLDDLLSRLISTEQCRVNEEKIRLSTFSGKLDSLSPLAVLSRGYAIVYGENGRAVPKAEQIRAGEAVRVRMKDGELHCTVNQTVLMNESEAETP